MRIVEVREQSIPISRYADPAISPGNLTTSVVSVTAQTSQGEVTGYGHTSIGRFAQGGLIRERFAPRLLAAPEFSDPREAWRFMMNGEKPGGHGERSVAIGALDMAVWDACAKAADMPVVAYISNLLGTVPDENIPVYAGGGYPYPANDVERLTAEIRAMLELGFERVKIKIGAASLHEDLRRIEAVMNVLNDGKRLAVDAMNAYDRDQALEAARALRAYDLWWFEDVCDPLDFETQALVAREYGRTMAAGEALFSVSEALLLDAHGGLQRGRDILLFDPVHCYGLTGYIRIVEALTAKGWPRSAFWPHGGHAFGKQIASALGLGGAEANPFAFAPLSSAEEPQTAWQRCLRAMP